MAVVPNGFGGWLQRFMMGRYGVDQLSQGLMILVLALIFLTLIPHLWFLQPVATAVLIYSFYRILSRNFVARQRENEAFLKLTEKPRRAIQKQAVKRANKDTTCYFKCKNCGAEYKVPKGKGTVRVTCPKCHEQTIHHT